jgi:anti-anti-sigma factor
MTGVGATLRHLAPAPPADRTIVRLGGALDFAAAPGLRERLLGVLHRGGSLLILDLSGVVSCDASGLAVLIGTQRRAGLLGGAVRLAAPSPPVAKLLRSTGLDRSFAIYPDLSGALAADPGKPARPALAPRQPLRARVIGRPVADSPTAQRWRGPLSVPFVPDDDFEIRGSRDRTDGLDTC